MKVYIFPYDQLSKQILIGRNVLKPGITVTSDTSCIKIFKSPDEHSNELNNIDQGRENTLKSIENKKCTSRGFR